MSDWTPERIEELRQKFNGWGLPGKGLVANPGTLLSALDEIDRLRSALAEAEKDAERLANNYRTGGMKKGEVQCNRCGYYWNANEPEHHHSACPITLHRERPK